MTEIYAVIQNGIVVNIQKLSANDRQDPSFTWIVATSLQPMPGIDWLYDGQNFSPPPSPLPSPPETRPVPTKDVRGQFWSEFGDDGIADQLQVCLKMADGSYVWKTIL